MNVIAHNFRRASALDPTGDSIARALAKFTKSPAQIENEKRLFRFREKRDLRNLIGAIRDERDLLSRLHCVGLEGFTEPPVSIDQALSRLERMYRVEKSHTGTPFASGNRFMAIKSRLFLARFFRRFHKQIWEFGA
ncbi:hypothetical protein FHS21_001293 [Phyllobacterium trifolii]|uniref:Uncharacterized protein n=1 Tax=Phyllobacterium trifolii TaxID=300193 RepID=A0A839U7D0_9HYPH|nr:hypothetical protein [Phyllobacterium trifolii]MBB3144892.1 hypothetical protein [Phyllobacterium trifolii]